MLRLLGAALLFGGLSLAGCSAGVELRRRTTLLRELVGALEQIQRELSFRLTPLPELFENQSRRSTGTLTEFFKACAGHARSFEYPFEEGWRREVEGLSSLVDTQVRECLERLGRNLGRCDGDGERELLNASVDELKEYLGRSEEENRQRGRLYSVLGVTAGAFFSILLL